MAPAAASASAAGGGPTSAKLDRHIVEVLRDGVHLCDLAASFGPGGGRGGRGARKMSKTPMGAHRQTLENIGEGNTAHSSRQHSKHKHAHLTGMHRRGRVGSSGVLSSLPQFRALTLSTHSPHGLRLACHPLLPSRPLSPTLARSRPLSLYHPNYRPLPPLLPRPGPRGGRPLLYHGPDRGGGQSPRRQLPHPPRGGPALWQPRVAPRPHCAQEAPGRGGTPPCPTVRFRHRHETALRRAAAEHDVSGSEGT